MANHLSSSPLLLKKTRSLRCPTRTVQLVNDTTTSTAAAVVTSSPPLGGGGTTSRLRRVFTTHGCRWTGGRRNNRRPSVVTAANSSSSAAVLTVAADETTTSANELRLASFIAQHSAGVHQYKTVPSGGANRSEKNLILRPTNRLKKKKLKTITKL